MCGVSVRADYAFFTLRSLRDHLAIAHSRVGELLARYKSGKLPKAFKIVPALANWEEILYLTAPHSWTPQAMYQATRLFASNLKPKMAQRFYNVILLDCVRTDIAETKRVNPHLYMALVGGVLWNST